MIKYTPAERFMLIQNSSRNVLLYDQDDNLRSINMNVDTRLMNIDGKD